MALRWGHRRVEYQFDATIKSLQPFSDRAGAMITGIVGDDVYPPFSGVIVFQHLQDKAGSISYGKLLMIEPL